MRPHKSEDDDDDDDDLIMIYDWLQSAQTELSNRQVTLNNNYNRISTYTYGVISQNVQLLHQVIDRNLLTNKTLSITYCVRHNFLYYLVFNSLHGFSFYSSFFNTSTVFQECFSFKELRAETP